MDHTQRQGHGSNARSPFFTEEHELLRAQVRRFVEERGQAVCAEVGGGGLRAARGVARRWASSASSASAIPKSYGGSGMDTLGSVVLAEELGRSTFSGVAITVLVHTDMASVHVFNAGTQAQKIALDARRSSAGETIMRRRRHRAGRGLRRQGDPHDRAARRRRLRAQRRQDVHHQRRARRSLFRRRQDRANRRPAAAASRCSWSRRARRASASAARSTSTAGARSDTAELVFEDCRVPAENVLGEEGRGFYADHDATSRTSGP